MKLKDIPVEVHILLIDLKHVLIFNNWRELAHVQLLDELVVIWKLSKENTNLFKDARVEDISKVVAISDQHHAFGDKWWGSQFLQSFTVFDKVANIW